MDFNVIYNTTLLNYMLKFKIQNVVPKLMCLYL